VMKRHTTLLRKTHNFCFITTNEHSLNIGHLVVIVKQDNTLALFEEIGTVNKKQFISFMNALRNIIEKK